MNYNDILIRITIHFMLKIDLHCSDESVLAAPFRRYLLDEIDDVDTCDKLFDYNHGENYLSTVICPQRVNDY